MIRVSQPARASRSLRSLRRGVALLFVVASLQGLSSCKFMMDEFFVLQKAPPALDVIFEEARKG